MSLASKSPSRISVLPPAVAERIAAGEVVERPSSVVKELVENSLDAGATEIVIALEEGGRARIEVMDNGHGLSAQDLPLAMERHATSKLKTLNDLDHIQSLGFRGEALPSIAAVADLTITSREKNTEHTYQLIAGQPGDPARAERTPQSVTFGHFLGSEHGTQIVAQNLFAQVPARLKFLKSPASEIAQVRDLIERIALSRPEVGFRLIHGDRTVLALKPQTELERVRTLLSDGEDFPVLHHFVSRGALQVRAYWLQGLSSPQMKKMLQVVNGRTLRDRLLQQALMSPFRQALLPGQFPAVALFVELDPAHLDVNVHPTKTEVRFLESSAIFSAVSSAYETLIQTHGMMGFAAGGAQLSLHSNHPSPSTLRVQPQFSTSQDHRNWPLLVGQPRETQLDVLETQCAPITPAARFQNRPYLGVIFQTYLMFDLGHELGLIDQHAAHERIRFENLTRRLRSGELLPSQQLLTPEPVRFDRDQKQLLEGRLLWLEKMGFDVEIFSEDQVLFRGLPIEWGHTQLSVRLRNLIDRVLSAETPNGDWALDERLFEKLASEACHSAVRAGDRLEPEEAHALLMDLFACEHPWNCPHGRPTIAIVPEARFEEWFQRRVP